ncbi:MAG: NADH-quinone oxidoreductase subunit J [Chloroflexota bacterium]|nr:NADH-quinone oxidoreductase subunit J [Chloroflexota bacterium]
MPWDVLIFYLIATICTLSAIGVVAVNNPVHSGVFLVLCFLNIAAIFVMLGAEFLAVVQVIVYTGAILVLVLFVLMLVDPDDLPEFHTGRPVQRYVGLLLGALLLLEIGAVILNRTVTGTSGTDTAASIAAVGGNTQALGRTLYTDYLLAFEVVSLVLTVGVIGAIVLALPERLGAASPVTRRGTISLAHPKDTDAALSPGPAGETPMPARPAATVAQPGLATAGRQLIMTKDPDADTTPGSRRS